MSATAVQLERVLAATPVPHSHDPAALLAQHAEVSAARASVIAGLGPALPLVDDADRNVWAAVAARDAAWIVALELARDQIAGRRSAARRLSVAYDVSPDDVGFEQVG